LFCLHAADSLASLADDVAAGVAARLLMADVGVRALADDGRTGVADESGNGAADDVSPATNQ